MALATAAMKVVERKKGPSCSFGKILSELTPEDLAFYESMVAEGKTWTYIADVFREDGIVVASNTMARHDRGDCKCR
jgi:hypothetical protein